MNRLLQYGSVENIPYYNCSGKSLEYWYSTGQMRPIFGWSLLVFGSFIVAIYIPVIYFIFKTNLIKHSCYKIISVLGIIDILATAISCNISGYFFIIGAVFCTHPTFIYITGSVGLACWCSACASALFLVINRVGDIVFPILSSFVFEGRGLYCGLILIVFYWFFVFTFTPTVLFNSVIMAWIGDPLVIDAEHKTAEIQSFYRNNVQSSNNWIFVLSICSLYTLYCISVIKLGIGTRSNASRQIFIQSSIICLFNTITAMTYNSLMFFTPPLWIVGIGEVCWSLVHACPAIIYLTMNKSIRSEFKKLFRKATGQKNQVSSTYLRPATIFSSQT